MNGILLRTVYNRSVTSPFLIRLDLLRFKLLFNGEMCYYGEARFLALPLGELSAKLTERVFPFSPRLRWLPGVTLSVTAYRRATSPRVGGKVYVAGTMCNTETNPNLKEFDRLRLWRSNGDDRENKSYGLTRNNYANLPARASGHPDSELNLHSVI